MSSSYTFLSQFSCNVIVLALTILRLLTPLLIFLNLPIGVLATLGVDTWDWNFFPFQSLDNYEYYQNWDKFLDIYTSCVFFIFMWFKWQAGKIKTVATGLFIFRLVGVIAYELFRQRQILFFFPNLFDIFFIFVVCLKIFSHRLRFTNLEIGYLTCALLFLKLIQEYFLHVYQKLPWELEWGKLISLGTYSVYGNIAIWFTLFLTLHVLIYLSLLRFKS